MHKPPLILIADDDSDFREIIATKLTQSGFWVAEAGNGEEAIEKAESLRPDLILLDMNMPKGNGTEAMIGIRNDLSDKDTKIIFLTSLDKPWPLVKEKNPEFAKEIGANDFLNKGVDLSEVVARVKLALGIQ